ncbi:hypothetical protein M9458_014623, partial [Cirrhinus mrigala]
HKIRLVVALLLPVLIFSHALCLFSSRRSKETADGRKALAGLNTPRVTGENLTRNR